MPVVEELLMVGEQLHASRLCMPHACACSKPRAQPPRRDSPSAPPSQPAPSRLHSPHKPWTHPQLQTGWSRRRQRAGCCGPRPPQRPRWPAPEAYSWPPPAAGHRLWSPAASRR